jgi:hypothetical protein
VIRIRQSGRGFGLAASTRSETDPVDRSTSGERRVTRAPVRLLYPLVGVGDAWSFRDAADRTWGEGNTGWAVEFEEHAE